MALGDAVVKINALQREMGMPPTVHGGFQGTAQAFQDSQSSMLVLIITALAAVYIILGILYESYIHPITILSTLPSAGVGALLALMLTKTELSMIALIGIILLIGIVKKNAILMIDFAVQAEMQEGKSPEDAIYQACLLRFRPILMTTMAALLGALPLALGQGVGSELRRPLGIAIVGGLILSQLLTHSPLPSSTSISIASSPAFATLLSPEALPNLLRSVRLRLFPNVSHFGGHLDQLDGHLPFAKSRLATGTLLARSTLIRPWTLPQNAESAHPKIPLTYSYMGIYLSHASRIHHLPTLSTLSPNRAVVTFLPFSPRTNRPQATLSPAWAWSNLPFPSISAS
jgi:hypothetical protein